MPLRFPYVRKCRMAIQGQHPRGVADAKTQTPGSVYVPISVSVAMPGPQSGGTLIETQLCS